MTKTRHTVGSISHPHYPISRQRVIYLTSTQCCGSRITDPDFYPSRIPIPNPEYRIPNITRATKEKEEKFCCPTFFVDINITVILDLIKKKIWVNLQRIIVLFTPKVVTKLSKTWVWDPVSEIRVPEKNPFRMPDPWVKKAPDPGSGSATLPPHYPVPFLRIWALLLGCRKSRNWQYWLSKCTLLVWMEPRHGW